MTLLFDSIPVENLAIDQRVTTFERSLEILDPGAGKVAPLVQVFEPATCRGEGLVLVMQVSVRALFLWRQMYIAATRFHLIKPC